MNTCGEESVIALGEGAHVVSSMSLPARATSERLMPAVRDLLADAGLHVAELQGIGVVHGPGSFTGARVGLSAAKGMCQGADVGLIAMSRLALVAAQAADNEKQVLALLDAGRGEFYAGLYRDRGQTLEWERLLKPEHQHATENAECITCEKKVASALGNRVMLVPEPGAEVLLRAMSVRAASGLWSDLATVDANYLRQTDAELLMSSGSRSDDRTR